MTSYDLQIYYETIETKYIFRHRLDWVRNADFSPNWDISDILKFTRKQEKECNNYFSKDKGYRLINIAVSGDAK